MVSTTTDRTTLSLEKRDQKFETKAKRSLFASFPTPMSSDWFSNHARIDFKSLSATSFSKPSLNSEVTEWLKTGLDLLSFISPKNITTYNAKEWSQWSWIPTNSRPRIAMIQRCDIREAWPTVCACTGLLPLLGKPLKSECALRRGLATPWDVEVSGRCKGKGQERCLDSNGLSVKM